MRFQIKYIGLVAILGLCWGMAPQARQVPALSYLALGDSYTIGESVSVADRYPVQVMNRLRADHIPCAYPEIIAATGWTTADLLIALGNQASSGPYDFVTLLIGVNNQYQHRSQAEYRQEFSILLRRAIQLAGDRPSHVTVLSIPDYSVTPFSLGREPALIAAQIDSFNAINYQVAREHEVRYLDITGESRKAAADPSLIAADGLHFSGREYAIWADLLEQVMKGIPTTP